MTSGEEDALEQVSMFVMAQYNYPRERATSF
jgi:hypothetical protein